MRKRWMAWLLTAILLLCSMAGLDVQNAQAATKIDPPYTVTLAAGREHVIGLKPDGTVISAGSNEDKQRNVSTWKDIVSISAGMYTSVGLKSDGTVVACGMNTDKQCNVSGWKNIVAVSAGSQHTVGLKSDGTVVAVGSNGEGQCKVSGWKNIKQICAGSWHTLGLKADGTVVATGDNEFGQCNVSSWTDIVALAANDWTTIGLKSDGRLVYTGGFDRDSRAVLNKTKSWANIASITAYDDTTVFAVRADGTYESTFYGSVGNGPYAAIVITPYNNDYVALRTDGTVVSRDYSAMNGKKLALPKNPFSGPAADEEPKDLGMWTLKAYTDDPNEYYIVNASPVEGVFSNTAAKDASLKVYLFCQSFEISGGLYESIQIRLFEYGSNRVKNTTSTTRYYDILLMDSAGGMHMLEGHYSSDSDDMYIGQEDAQTIIEALRKGGMLRFTLTRRDNKAYQYGFTIIDASGFDDAYDEWYTK